MKRLLVVFPALCLAGLLILSGCAPAGEVLPSEDYGPGNENPYIAVINYLWGEDWWKENDVRYVSIDLAGLSQEDAAALAAVLETYSKDTDLTILTKSYDQLKEEGYTDGMNNGVLLTFSVISKSDTDLSVRAKTSQGGMDTEGAEFSLVKQGVTWKINKVDNHWIS